MHKVNIKDVPEVEFNSPKGKFSAFYRGISEALGRDPKSTDLMKRHPFDLELSRIPPGAIMCPYHSHSAQWEMYLVISGKGTVRDESGTHEVTAGDSFIYPPGEAHQIFNRGTEDFIYYTIADNPLGEWCHYPDSKKWLHLDTTGGKVINGGPADYFQGEE